MSRSVVSLGFLLLLSGCAVGPDYVMPDISLPETWQQKGSLDFHEHQQDQEWWHNFKDPALETLIEKAVLYNRDLAIVELQVEEARGKYKAAFGDLFPKIGGDGQVLRSVNTTPGFLFPNPTNTYTLAFDATWELDFFGKHRRTSESACANLGSITASRHKVYVTLLAEVANTYLQIRLMENQIIIAKENIEAQEETFELTKKQLQAGQSNKLDVLRAESQLWTTRSQLPYYESALVQSTNKLAFLLGIRPECVETDLLPILSKSKGVPKLSAALILTAPACILRQRPDIRQAERDLASATAMQGVAIAAQYPTISLSGLLGFQALKTYDYFNSANKSWSEAVGFKVPFFSFGRIQGNIDAADARQQQALKNFEKTIDGALMDVENALVSYLKESERYIAMARDVALLREAVQLARKRYREGHSSFLEVLDTERSLYLSESKLAQSEADVATYIVALYKAMGGGWVEKEPEDQGISLR